MGEIVKYSWPANIDEWNRFVGGVDILSGQEAIDFLRRVVNVAGRRGNGVRVWGSRGEKVGEVILGLGGQQVSGRFLVIPDTDDQKVLATLAVRALCDSLDSSFKQNKTGYPVTTGISEIVVDLAKIVNGNGLKVVTDRDFGVFVKRYHDSQKWWRR